MFFNAAFPLCALLVGRLASASPLLESRDPEDNNCGENSSLICYGSPDGTSQNLDVSDVSYAASQVRYIGQHKSGPDAFWTSKYIITIVLATVHHYLSVPDDGRAVRKPGSYTNAGLLVPRTVDCQEWTVELPGGGPIMVLAKHITPRYNSSILWEDIATTIDGGPTASANDVKSSLLGCGTHGGQVGVKVNASNPAYSADDYKAGKGRTEGIVIKIVRNPNWVDS